jgi:hypothetical protein
MSPIRTNGEIIEFIPTKPTNSDSRQGGMVIPDDLEEVDCVVTTEDTETAEQIVDEAISQRSDVSKRNGHSAGSTHTNSAKDGKTAGRATAQNNLEDDDELDDWDEDYPEIEALEENDDVNEMLKAANTADATLHSTIADTSISASLRHDDLDLKDDFSAGEGIVPHIKRNSALCVLHQLHRMPFSIAPHLQFNWGSVLKMAT